MLDLAELERHTRSSKYPGKPFGYEYNMDMREIEEGMIADGFKRGEPSFIFEGSRRYQASKAGDLTFRQRQDLAKWLGLSWAGGGVKAPSSELTPEEAALVADRFSGANDPTGQSILAKMEIIKRHT